MSIDDTVKLIDALARLINALIWPCVIAYIFITSAMDYANDPRRKGIFQGARHPRGSRFFVRQLKKQS
jgi:hypothetical protein